MLQIYIAFFKIFIYISLGLILNKTRVIDRRSEVAMSNVLLKAVLPFTILGASQVTFSYQMLRGIFGVAAFAACYCIIGLLLVYVCIKHARIDQDEKRIIHVLTVFSNTSFVGMPLMQELYGEQGLLLAAVFNLISNLFFYSAGAVIVSKKHFRVLDLISNPVSLVSIISIVLFAIPWRMPFFIQDTISLVGDMNVPLSMMIIGSMLSTISPKKLFSDIKAYCVVIVKMFLIPAVVMGFLFVIRGFVEALPVTLITLLIMSALPPNVTAVIFAEQYDTAPEFCTRTVALSMLVMLFSLLFWVGLAGKIFI
ncbi:MAG: AEC family transporter [Saccharofermentans sp.]|nr:AEC family transporter [Saccharofermentans sp.]